MDWRRTDNTERVTEWERDDGDATIRLRERTDGEWTVRLDRMYQASEGSTYRRETVAERDAARELVERWQAEFAVEE